MFEYFGKNYAWNIALATLVEEVGTLAEPMEALGPLVDLASAEPAVANAAWHDAMHRLATRLERLADADLHAGHALTAARKYHRAAMYFIRVERMMPPRAPDRLDIYRRALADFRRARELGGDGVEFVDIPFENGFIPALLVRAPGDAPAPLVIHLQGFDSVKETQWPMLQEYRRRGLSVLILDQPGAGGALRLHELRARVESESYVSKVVDFVLARADIATPRLGLAGLSMGGFFAPRAAAFEPRIRAVASWGAFYRLRPPAQAQAAAPAGAPPPRAASLPSMLQHALWSWGLNEPEQYAALAQRMTLENVLPRIACPYLVMHGEGDRQIPLADAQQSYDEALVANKRLKIFRKEEEGGVEHCQLDNRAMGSDYIADWFAEIL